MFTGTEFLIGIGVLVVISAIWSIHIIRHPKNEWEYDHTKEVRSYEDMLDDPSWHSIQGNTFHDMF